MSCQGVEEWDAPQGGWLNTEDVETGKSIQNNFENSEAWARVSVCAKPVLEQTCTDKAAVARDEETGPRLQSSKESDVPGLACQPSLQNEEEGREKLLMYTLLVSQLYLYANLLAAWLLYLCMRSFWPKHVFFSFDPWHPVDGNASALTQSLIAFWPLACWACLVAVVIQPLLQRSKVREANSFDAWNWALGMLLSLSAGLSEELGHRWLFVLEFTLGYQMGMLAEPIIFWPVALGILLLGIWSLCGSNFTEPSRRWTVVFIVCVAIGLAGLRLILWHYDQPCTLTEWLFRCSKYMANWFTLGYLDIVWGSSPKFDPALVAGLLFSNAAFRDGHKYQGALGCINAWFLGNVFLYCTLTHGLLAAIVLHAAYDIIIHSLSLSVQLCRAMAPVKA